MKKMFFEEPEMELVRFNAKDIYTSTSAENEQEITEENIEEGPDDE